MRAFSRQGNGNDLITFSRPPPPNTPGGRGHPSPAPSPIPRAASAGRHSFASAGRHSFASAGRHSFASAGRHSSASACRTPHLRLRPKGPVRRGGGDAGRRVADTRTRTHPPPRPARTHQCHARHPSPARARTRTRAGRLLSPSPPHTQTYWGLRDPGRLRVGLSAACSACPCSGRPVRTSRHTRRPRVGCAVHSRLLCIAGKAAA